MNLNDPVTFLLALVVAPALAAALAAGLGLLLEVVAGIRLGTLVVPAGFAAAVVLMTAALELGLSGPLAAILCLLGAVAGVLLALRRRRSAPGAPGPRARLRSAWPPLGAGVLTYAIGILPLVGSGRLGVLGYSLNNDSAVHISAVELLHRYGAQPTGTEESSFLFVSGLFRAGYPIGSYAWPLIARTFTGAEPFFLWTPMIALSAGVAALVVLAMLRRLGLPPLAAAGAGVAVASGYLPYSYLAQGGAKEVLFAVVLYTAVALFAHAHAEGYSARSLVPPGLAAAATVCVLGLGAGAWLAPAALGVVLVLRLNRPAGRRLKQVAGATTAGAVVALLGALPTLGSALAFVESSRQGIENPAQVGNLLDAVPWYEAFNFWVALDYRQPRPDDIGLTALGVLVAAALAVAGTAALVRRRDPGIPLAVFVGAAGALVISMRFAIYFDAKAYMALAPALGLASAAGLWWLYRRSLRTQLVAVGLGVFLALGVAVSAAMVYAGAFMTPESRFEELGALNERYRGQGRILVNEREDYAKYLLRDVDPWESWGFWTPDRGLASDPRLDPEHTPDFDDYTLEHMKRFPLLLERKRPGGSRPPANYRPVEETVHYRVWRRTGPTPAMRASVGEGRTSGTAPLDCRQGEVRDVIAAARRAGRPVTVATAGRPSVVATPGAWKNTATLESGPTNRYLSRLGGTGIAGPRLAAGRYQVFIQGSFSSGVRLYVNGRQVGDVLNDYGLHDGWQPVGTVSVPGGPVDVGVLGLRKPLWQSGSRRPDVSGPLAFMPDPSARRVERVPAERMRALCGTRVDWIELPA